MREDEGREEKRRESPLAKLFRRVAPASGRLSVSSWLRSVLESVRTFLRTPRRAHPSRDRKGAVVLNPSRDCKGAVNVASMEKQILRSAQDDKHELVVSSQEPVVSRNPSRLREQAGHPSRARQSRDREGAEAADPNPESRLANPDPPTLTPEQFRRMLTDALADPVIARRLLPPILGTAFPIEGGNPYTANQIPKFLDTTGALTDSIMAEKDGNKVGIGTTDPSERLAIESNTETNLLLKTTGQGSTRVKLQPVGAGLAALEGLAGTMLLGSVGDLILATGTGGPPQLEGYNERMRVLATGNVGIGTPSPGARLHVSAPSGTTALVVDGDTNNWVGVFRPGGVNKVAIRGGASGSDVALYDGYALTMYSDQGTTTKNRLSATGNSYFNAGNLGIGTTSPQGILDIAGKTVFLKPKGGVQDDTNQINDAMQNLEASGGIVFLTPGEYRVTNLTGRSNVHLWGAGVGATAIRFTGSSDDMINFAGKSNFSVRNITWDRNDVTGVGTAIHVTWDGSGNPSHTFDISDCSVVKMNASLIDTKEETMYGIAIIGANNFRVERNYIKFSVSNRGSNEAIVVAAAEFSQLLALAYDGIINANHCDGSGIQADGHHLKVTNNLVHDFQFGGGITTNPDTAHEGNHDNEIIGNTVYNGTGEDVNETWCAGIENFGFRSVVSGNVCYANAGPGIASGGWQSTVANNVCYNNGIGHPTGRPGIAIIHADPNPVANASESVYVGNRCFDTHPVPDDKTQTYGIADEKETEEAPFCSDVTIGVNNLLGNKEGDANIQGTNYALVGTSSGKVGIGTMSPTNLLTVDGNGRIIGTLLLGAATAPKQVSGGPELISFQHPDFNHVILGAWVEGEDNARFLASIHGFLEWGFGGTGDQDVALFHNWLGGLAIQSFGQSGDPVYSDHVFSVHKSTGDGSVGQSILRVDISRIADTPPGSPVVHIENGCRLAIGGADGGALLDVLGSAGVTAIRAIPASAGDVAFLTALPGDNYARFAVLGDGSLVWGGGANPGDITVYRSQPGHLACQGVFHVLNDLFVDNGGGVFAYTGPGSFQRLDIGGFANVIDLNRNGNFRAISLIADVTDETRAHVTKGVNKFGKFQNLDTGLVASITVTDGVITGWTEA